MHQPSDEALMARFREAFDEEALDQLVGRHHARACRVATALLGDADTAEDAVQEAFIRVVRQRDRYMLGQRFSPWFYTILRNLCRDHHRWRSRHERKIELLSLQREPSSQEPSRGVLELLQLLTPPEREILSLRFVEGMPFREIARLLGCTEEAAKKRGQRAIKRLRAVDAPSAVPSRGAPPATLPFRPHPAFEPP